MEVRGDTHTQQCHQRSNQRPERFIIHQCHEETHMYHIIRLVELCGKWLEDIVRIEMYV